MESNCRRIRHWLVTESTSVYKTPYPTASECSSNDPKRPILFPHKIEIVVTRLSQDFHESYLHSNACLSIVQYTVSGRCRPHRSSLSSRFLHWQGPIQESKRGSLHRPRASRKAVMRCFGVRYAPISIHSAPSLFDPHIHC